MRTHVGLLRGINVGGRNSVAMADLRAVVASLGYEEVATYIQSGNVVFTSSKKQTAVLAEALERRIAEDLKVTPRVLVLARSELEAVVAGNPFPKETDGKRLHAGFGMAKIDSTGIAAVADAEQRARDKGSRDRAVVIGRTLYLHTPDGMGRSVLATELDRGSGAKANAARTFRNWATVNKLLELLD